MSFGSHYESAAAFHADLLAFASESHLAYVDGDGQDHLELRGHRAFKAQIPKIDWLDLRPRRRPEFHEETATLLMSFLIDRFHPAVFFDIGAAYGHFARVAASHRQNPPAVHAFEMRPDRHENLRRALSQEGYEDRVSTHLAGLSDRHRGETDIWYSRHRLFEREPTLSEAEGPWWIRLRFFLRGDKSRKLTRRRVLITTIDQFCADRGIKPDLLKIDVDGYEGKVLRGAKETLAKYNPVVLLELHKDRLLMRNGEKRHDVVAILFELGYRAFFFTDHESLGNCRVVEVGPGNPLLGRQETDHILFFCNN